MKESTFEAKFSWMLDNEPPSLMAQKILNKASNTDPPTDLFYICELLGDLKIVEDEMDEDGYILSGTNSEYLIVYSKRSKSSNRYRFTIAHEIGHFVLYKSAVSQFNIPMDEAKNLQLPFSHSKKEIEKWCNSFASELLIPSEWIGKFFTSEEDVFDAALKKSVIDSFLVSNELFYRKLAETFRNVIVIYFNLEEKSNSIQVVGSIPFGFSYSSNLVTQYREDLIKGHGHIMEEKVTISHRPVLVVFIRK